MEAVAHEIPIFVLHAFGWMLPVLLLAWGCLVLDSHGLNPLKAIRRFIALVPPVERLVLGVLAAGLVVLGSTKHGAPRRSPGSSGAVTAEDVARGWRLVASGDGGPVEMPACAVTNGPLRRRGGFDWAFRVEPEGWRLPYPGGVLAGVTVFASGEVRPDARTPYFPRPLAEGVSLLPEARWGLLPNGGASVFRHAVTPGGSLLLDWRNALVGRDPHAPTNLQLELLRDGGFVWRTDGGSRAYEPVLPFDWDGDGLENSVDPEPLVRHPADAHGANDEWRRVVCSNVFEVVGHELRWRGDVNTNAYYFVDVAVADGPAPIAFNADRPSRLGSPVVVARGGEVGHVPLLVGVEYAVTSTVPIAVTPPADGFAEVVAAGERACTVRWPLGFEFTRETAGSYSVRAVPYDPGGVFAWDSAPSGATLAAAALDASCHCWSGSGAFVSFGEHEHCTCRGGCHAAGTFAFESAEFVVTGGVCRCGRPHDPHQEGPGSPLPDPRVGGLWVEFSRPVVVFEDAYTNAPGDVVARRSTTTRLTISASGGLNGGSFVLAPRNLDKLSAVAEGPINLPGTMTLGPLESFHSTCIYEAQAASGGEGDISVAGYFIDNGGERQNAVAKLTAVRIGISSIIAVEGLPSRHRWGLGERFFCKWEPSLPGFQLSARQGCVKERSYSSREDFLCPMSPATGIICVTCGAESYTPDTQVLQPSHIEAREGEELLFPVGIGCPGGVGLAMDLHVMPDTVSFRALEFIEQPSDDSVVEGYFLDPSLSELWFHDEDKGAGVWWAVQNENFCFRDEAAMGCQLPLPCSSGRIVWKIPVEWRERGNDKFVSRRLSVVPQTFTMSAGGTLRVSKYQYWAERAISGARRKSEGVR